MNLNELNIGDSVTVFIRGKAAKIEKVARKTKTTIVTSSESKFNINTGNRVPRDNYSFHCPHIQPTTDDDRRTIKLDWMISKLMSFSFHNLSYVKLKHILEIIEDD